MTILVGGGGGVGPVGPVGPDIAGLTSDGSNGIDVTGAVFTEKFLQAIPVAGVALNDDLVSGQIINNLQADTYSSCVAGYRSGGQNGHSYFSPVISAYDSSDTGATALMFGSTPGLPTQWAVNKAGGMAGFGKTPPTAPRTLPQATITAIIDANAKAAVQACANALSDMGVLTLT